MAVEDPSKLFTLQMAARQLATWVKAEHLTPDDLAAEVRSGGPRLQQLWAAATPWQRTMARAMAGRVGTDWTRQDSWTIIRQFAADPACREHGRRLQDPVLFQAFHVLVLKTLQTVRQG